MGRTVTVDRQDGFRFGAGQVASGAVGGQKNCFYLFVYFFFGASRPTFGLQQYISFSVGGRSVKTSNRGLLPSTMDGGWVFLDVVGVYATAMPRPAEAPSPGLYVPCMV